MDNYLRDLARLAAWAGGAGARGPDEVTAAQLREFIYHLKDVGLAPATIRRQISAIRTYYRFLVGEGHAARDPSERLESPKGWRVLPSVLSVVEVEKLIAAPDTDTPLGIRDHALLEFAYATGARVSELVGVKQQDVVFEDGIARLFGKGAKERLAGALLVPPSTVSVKAKTNEGMGWIGRGEGIAVIAVALLKP